MDDDKRGGATTVFDQRDWEVNGDVYNINGDLLLNKDSTREDFSKALADLTGELGKLHNLPAEVQQQVSESLNKAATAAKEPDAEKEAIVEYLDTAKEVLATVKTTVDGAKKLAKTIKKVAGWVAAFLI